MGNLLFRLHAVSRHRMPVVAATLAVAAVLCAGLVLVPRLVPSTGRSADSIRATFTVPGTASAVASETSAHMASPIPSSATLPATIHANGWPVQIDNTTSAWDGRVGPDGTAYLEYEAFGSDPFLPQTELEFALDPFGHPKTGWLKLPNGQTGTPVAFGPDGSIYGWGDDGLWSFSLSGRLRYQISLPDASQDALWPTADGQVHVATVNGMGSGVATIDPVGHVVRSWTAPGTDGVLAIRPNGSALLEDRDEDSCSIRSFSSSGKELSTDGGTCWGELAMSPDGTLVGWTYMRKADDDWIEATRMAVLGDDGRPASGWPIEIPGTASGPAFGPNGRIFATVVGVSPFIVLGLDHQGRPLKGWPVKVKDEPIAEGNASFTMCCTWAYTLAPTVTADGLVVASGVHSVVAYDQSGKIAPGWPFKLPSAWAFIGNGAGDMVPSLISDGALYAAPGNETRFYLVLEDRLLAIDRQALVVPGWPVRPGTPEEWDEIFPGPDGGLMASFWYAADASHPEDYFRMYRWLPDGTIPR